MAAVVVPALKAFDAELTSVAPNRVLPTWYLGDAEHRKYASGHNPDDTPGSKAEYSDADNKAEIRAGDYRLPLRASFTTEQLIQLLVKLCRQGKITWISYIIYNRRIWSAAHGWTTRAYVGKNPHDKHFHISTKSDTKSENSTAKVGLRILIEKPPVVKPPATGSPNVPYHITAAHQCAAGHRGTDVVTIQKEMGTKRGIKAIDGVYGPQTVAAVKKFQREAKLSVDGIVGKKTWKALGY